MKEESLTESIPYDLLLSLSQKLQQSAEAIATLVFAVESSKIDDGKLAIPWYAHYTPITDRPAIVKQLRLAAAPLNIVTQICSDPRLDKLLVVPWQNVIKNLETGYDAPQVVDSLTRTWPLPILEEEETARLESLFEAEVDLEPAEILEHLDVLDTHLQEQSQRVKRLGEAYKEYHGQWEWTQRLVEPLREDTVDRNHLQRMAKYV